MQKPHLCQNKTKFTVNAFGLPVGDLSTKMSSRCGRQVHSTVPISFKDWRTVPQEKKDELWRRLQDGCIVPQSYKDKCLKSMADAMRKYKNKLRTTQLDPHTTHEARLNNHPPGVRPEDWADFVEHNANPKTIEQWRKNSDVIKKLNIYHTSGRYGYARLEEKLGRIQELLSSQEVGSQDILNDPLTKVFGTDTRGRVQGVGNNVSRTQILSSAPALEKLAAKEKNVNEQMSEIKDLKEEVKRLSSELAVMACEQSHG